MDLMNLYQQSSDISTDLHAVSTCAGVALGDTWISPEDFVAS